MGQELTTKEKRKRFFMKVGTMEIYFVGGIRNEYGELFCLYKYLLDPLTKTPEIFITGDELDWEEFVFNYETGKIREFRLSMAELNGMFALTSYLRSK